MTVDALISRIVEERAHRRRRPSLAERVGPLVEQVLAAGGDYDLIAGAVGVKPVTVEEWLDSSRRHREWEAEKQAWLAGGGEEEAWGSEIVARARRAAGRGYQPDKIDEKTSRLARRAYRTDSARFDVECRQCHAPVGEACVGPDGPLALVHTVRAWDAGLTDRFERVAAVIAEFENDVDSGRDCPPVDVEDRVVIFAEDGEVRAEVRMVCGHASTIRAAGSDDETVLAVLRSREWQCPECRYADRNLLAAATAAVEGWPDLEGTPRQVAWANSIRADLVAEVRAYTLRQGFAERWEALVTARLVKVTTAKSWIDVRDTEIFHVILMTLIPSDFAEPW